ncbi:DUF2892 domain-containing protein [Persicimonas caeni]|jgi:hypothetical protein|uniref:DUF2892 domain-containing protein n=1 Tax=Persicimonas caeni TaxID=2292766 RepID=A0A4Y6PPT3_PERCE|nr:DUF2892 domain-containing protein [Persicimonas caeni]QDG50328.1 DUF2892 domain-containing protein [Persicimonas caeni]QED31549.1 DUF2892 domain-containing protein [Persicimonas caeni]
MTALKKLTNEGSIDRIARVVLGVVLLSLVFVGPQTAWGLLGIIPLATGAVGFCPLYRLVGINTCKNGECAPQS